MAACKLAPFLFSKRALLKTRRRNHSINNTTIDRQQYPTEMFLALQHVGYEVNRTAYGYWAVSLNGQPICKVREVGEITYHQGDLCTDKLNATKGRIYEFVRTTAEYMRAMENAPPLKAAGLGDGYQLPAEFNGVALAGHPTEKYKYGNRHFRATGYYVSTVGLQEKALRKYI